MDFANFFFNFFAKKIALSIAQSKDFHILEAIYSVPSPVRARAEDIPFRNEKRRTSRYALSLVALVLHRHSGIELLLLAEFGKAVLEYLPAPFSGVA